MEEHPGGSGDAIHDELAIRDQLAGRFAGLVGADRAEAWELVGGLTNAELAETLYATLADQEPPDGPITE